MLIVAASTGPNDPKDKLTGRERSLANLNRKGRPKGSLNVYSKADKLMKLQCQEVFRAILGFEELEEGHFNAAGMAIRQRLREMLVGPRAVDPHYVRLVNGVAILTFGRPPIQKQADGPRRHMTFITGPPYDPMKEQTDRMIRELEEEELHAKLKDPTFDVVAEEVTETPDGDFQIVRGKGDT